jgi:hypothetical protein
MPAIGRHICCAAIAAILFASGTPVVAALTTEACLAKKLKEWGRLRNCQAKESGKALQGKSADPAKCQAKLDAKLAAISALATASAIACRYGVNTGTQAGTVTDYDTGLQWEQKTNDDTVHGWHNQYYWCFGLPQNFPNCLNTAHVPDGTVFTAFLGTLDNGTSSDAGATSGCFAGHCDWRLPAIEELARIRDASQPDCGADGGLGSCIDEAVFGPTSANYYLSATTAADDPNVVWSVYFGETADETGVGRITKVQSFWARAVRSAL